MTELQRKIIEIGINNKNLWVLYSDNQFSYIEKKIILIKAIELIIPYIKKVVDCTLLDKVIPTLNSGESIVDLYTELYAFNSKIKSEFIAFIIEIMIGLSYDNGIIENSGLQLLRQMTRKL